MILFKLCTFEYYTITQGEGFVDCLYFIYLAFLTFFIRASLMSLCKTNRVISANIKFQSWYLCWVHMLLQGNPPYPLFFLLWTEIVEHEIFFPSSLSNLINDTHFKMLTYCVCELCVINCFAERSRIRPQRSNPEQLAQKWTQYSGLIQVWIWIVVKYLTYYRFLNKCSQKN